MEDGRVEAVSFEDESDPARIGGAPAPGLDDGDPGQRDAHQVSGRHVPFATNPCPGRRGQRADGIMGNVLDQEVTGPDVSDTRVTWARDPPHPRTGGKRQGNEVGRGIGGGRGEEHRCVPVSFETLAKGRAFGHPAGWHLRHIIRLNAGDTHHEGQRVGRGVVGSRTLVTPGVGLIRQ